RREGRVGSCLNKTIHTRARMRTLVVTRPYPTLGPGARCSSVALTSEGLEQSTCGEGSNTAHARACVMGVWASTTHVGKPGGKHAGTESRHDRGQRRERRRAVVHAGRHRAA